MFSLIPTPYKIMIAVTLLVGSYTTGYVKGKNTAKEIIEKFKLEYEQTILEIQKNQIKVDTKVVTRYKDRVVYVEKNNEQTQDLIKNIGGDVILSNGWVYSHDSSARGNVPDSTQGTDGTPSGVKANEALGVVADNYTQYEKVRKQLIELQDWVTETQKNVEASNKNKGKK